MGYLASRRRALSRRDAVLIRRTLGSAEPVVVSGFAPGSGRPAVIVPDTPCRPSCCKTPYGHSTVRDSLPDYHKDACHCHAVAPPPKTETEGSTYA